MAMKGTVTRLAPRIVLAACFVLLASLPPHACWGLILFEHYPYCGDLCSKEFWAGATGDDVATEFARQPKALSHRGAILRRAVRSGASADAVKGLLRAGAPPKARYVLHEAVEHNATVIRVLLDAGADPNAAYGARTPLHIAVRTDQSEAVSLLLAAGADPQVRSDYGKTPVDLAEGVGRRRTMLREMLSHLRTVRPSSPPCGKLCEPKFWRTATAEQVRQALTQATSVRGRSPLGDDPLHVALAAGADVELVRLLLDQGADPNSRNARDDTPLHVAARTPGGAAAIPLLLERGAMLEAGNVEDQTPLHAASERGSTIDAMRVLLKAGANPNLLTGSLYGDSAWTLAARQSEGPVATRLLLEHGDVKEAEDGHAGLLPSAAGWGHPETVMLLLDQGISPDEGNASGDPALNYAARKGNLATLRVLLARGADPHRYSAWVWPRLVPLAEAVGNPAAIELLVRFGADPDGHPKFLLPGPLHRAATLCEEVSLSLLLALGANPNVWDRSFDTPLGLAVESVARSRQGSGEPGPEKSEACERNVAELVRHGASPHKRDNEGVTPLEKAKKYAGVSDAIIHLLENVPRRD